MWTVSLFENPLGGIGIHGVLVIRNSQGNVERVFEGLATNADGSFVPIGSTLTGQRIIGYSFANSGNMGSGTETTILRGSEIEIRNAMTALVQVNDKTIELNQPYEFPNPIEVILGSSSRSNRFMSQTLESGNSRIAVSRDGSEAK